MPYICNNCGRSVTRSDRFCPSCGIPLAPVEQPRPRTYTCPICRGSGQILGPWHKEICPRCRGTGVVVE